MASLETPPFQKTLQRLDKLIYQLELNLGRPHTVQLGEEAVPSQQATEKIETKVKEKAPQKESVRNEEAKAEKKEEEAAKKEEKTEKKEAKVVGKKENDKKQKKQEERNNRRSRRRKRRRKSRRNRKRRKRRSPKSRSSWRNCSPILISGSGNHRMLEGSF